MRIQLDITRSLCILTLIIFASASHAQTASLDLDLVAGDQGLTIRTGNFDGTSQFQIEVHASGLASARGFEINLTFDPAFLSFQSFSTAAPSGEQNVFRSNGAPSIFTTIPATPDPLPLEKATFVGSINAGNAVSGSGLIGVATFDRLPAFAVPVSTTIVLGDVQFVDDALNLSRAELTEPNSIVTLTAYDEPPPAQAQAVPMLESWQLILLLFLVALFALPSRGGRRIG